MTATDDRIDATTRCHEELAAFADGLGADDLRRASGCSEWDVAQVLSHLGSAAELSLMTLEAAVSGAPLPGMEISQPTWDRWNALDPSAMASGFLEWGGRLIERYNAFDAADRESFRVKLPFLPEPVDLTTVVGFRLTELLLHGWDVRVGFDAAAVLSPHGLASVVDDLGSWIGYFGQPAGVSASIAVRTSDPAREFGLTIVDGVSLGPTPDSPTASLSLPAEAWMRLATGRLAAAHTPATVTLTGLSLDQLRKVFPGI